MHKGSIKRGFRRAERFWMMPHVLRRVLVHALCGSALVVALLVAALPASAAASGSISGRVVAAADGSPTGGICVSIQNGPSTVTDADGTYVLEGLDTGSYVLQFSDCNTPPTFVTEWYDNRDRPDSADPVSVTDGADTALADVALQTGVSVHGTVTDTDGNPIEGISVNVNSNSNGSGAGTTTAADGTYATSPLPAGDYRVQFSDMTQTWATQHWNGQPSWNTANLLTLAATDGPSHDGIDAHLTHAATVAGTVTVAGGGAPLENICVEADVPNNGGWDWVGGTSTAADGTYSIGQLPATDVRVQFRDCATGDYTTQWYAAASSFNDSTPIVLGAGEQRTGIDAELELGVHVSGHVADGAGNPIAGINVNVNPTGPGNGAWGSTDANGDYTTSAVSPGDYRVQFAANGPDPAWATRYWDGQDTWNTATILTLAPSDAPVRSGIDATLTAAATVTGTVTDAQGQPVVDECVTAVVQTPGGYDGLANANTGSDGTYRLTGLASTSLTVYFQDCNGHGYVDQWWNGQPDVSAATFFTPPAGQVTSGIDAQLAAAGRIAGHVTDGNGDPLAGICAQATTTTSFGGLARTNGNGDYTINVAAAGTYRVQFVDCNDAPTFAAQWWNGAATEDAAQPIPLATGGSAEGVDAVLVPGAPATLSGRVTNLGGAAMTTACVVAYLPNQFAKFAPVDVDGNYEIDNLPSGTYALAALGCPSEESDPSPVVPDPTDPSVAYNAMWWNGVPLHLVQNPTGGPDPLAQGADMVTLTPGSQVGDHDWCFGCGAITITGTDTGARSITLSFQTPGLAAGDGDVAAQAAINSSLAYSASCTSNDGGVAGSGTGAGVITVDGLSAGSVYQCQVTASADGIAYANSTTTASIALPAPPRAPAVTPAATATPLAFTGGAPGPFAVLGGAMVVLGLVTVLGSRLRRSRRSSPCS